MEQARILTQTLTRRIGRYAACAAFVALLLTVGCGSGIAPDKNLLADVPPAAIAADMYTGLHAYGDSITAGTGATEAHGYVNLLASYLKLPLKVIATPGSTACDQFPVNILRDLSFDPRDERPMFSLMVGSNDASTETGLYESGFTSCHQAVVAWLAVPQSARIAPLQGQLQTSGGCLSAGAVHLGAAYCSTRGSLNFNVLNTYGGPIYVWYLLSELEPGDSYFRVLVDGVEAATASTKPAAWLLKAPGRESMGLLRIPANAGAHAVSVETPTGGVGILALGTPPSKERWIPTVLVGDVPNRTESDSRKTQLALSQAIHSNVSLLQRDGLDVRIAEDRTTMLATPREMSDTVHPNDLGHEHIATAFARIFAPTAAKQP